jgi:hypothetical protein
LARRRVNGDQLRLLAVVLQDLIAGGRNLGAILLQAGQDGEITLIDHRTAKALHVTSTGLLLIRGTAALLGEGIRRNRDRQQGKCQENSTHRIPSFRQQEILFPNEFRTDFLGWQAPRSAATNKGQALANAAKFTTLQAHLVTG